MQKVPTCGSLDVNLPVFYYLFNLWPWSQYSVPSGRQGRWSEGPGRGIMTSGRV